MCLYPPCVGVEINLVSTVSKRTAEKYMPPIQVPSGGGGKELPLELITTSYPPMGCTLSWSNFYMGLNSQLWILKALILNADLYFKSSLNWNDLEESNKEKKILFRHYLFSSISLILFPSFLTWLSPHHAVFTPSSFPSPVDSPFCLLTRSVHSFFHYIGYAELIQIN